MGQQASQPVIEPPLNQQHTDQPTKKPKQFSKPINLNDVVIPEKLKPEFDDIINQNEKVLAAYMYFISRMELKKKTLKLRDFDHHVVEDTPSETEVTFEKVFMGKEFFHGNYECMKDWKEIDFSEWKFTAVQRKKLVTDLRKCASSEKIHDPMLLRDDELIQQYYDFFTNSPLKNFPNYYNIVHGEEYKHLEDVSSSNPNFSFEERLPTHDRNQLNEIVEVLKLEKSLERVVQKLDIEDAENIPPSFLNFLYQQTGLHCRKQILECMKERQITNKTEEETITDFQYCVLNSKCPVKSVIYLGEKKEEQLFKD